VPYQDKEVTLKRIRAFKKDNEIDVYIQEEKKKIEL
jgi:hypothetical protein